MDDDVVSLDPPVSRINGAFSSTSLSVVVQDDVISVVPGNYLIYLNSFPNLNQYFYLCLSFSKLLISKY